MDSLSERAALVTLLRTGDRPWAEYAELVEEAGSAVAVLDREPETSLFASDEHAKARVDVTAWEDQGLGLLTVLDDGYPGNLRAVHDRPPLIFVRGALTPQDARAVAVVGSRQASPRGADAAKRIATHLVDRGFTVVSGLAAGIDTAAHTGALADAGRTLAVIGTGLNHAYPPQNARLQERIARECAVISQFWPDALPTRRSFPMRNAVMSGLTLGTVVVEATQTSGARLQARLALAHGRSVFLLESLVRTQQWAREFARRPGTHVVRTPAQIVETVLRLTGPDALVG
jgi:DNA processing protein